MSQTYEELRCNCAGRVEYWNVQIDLIEHQIKHLDNVTGAHPFAIKLAEMERHRAVARGCLQYLEIGYELGREAQS